jgi:hypothetical protein
MPTLPYTSVIRRTAVSTETFGVVSTLTCRRTVGTPGEPANPRGHRQFASGAG